ncbi:hypothetical protein TNCV_1322051 [Trichonephila clavipes]|nr:hypothetical protein TNCV_1322051 [Trichonephila clavipes]
MKAMPTEPISVFMTVDTEVHEEMFRSGGQSDTKPPMFSSQVLSFLGKCPSTCPPFRYQRCQAKLLRVMCRYIQQLENCVEFLSKEMPDIKIDDN